MKHIALISMSVAALVLTGISLVRGQKVPQPTNVKVVNTSSQPVPVAGSVSVSNLGTATVSVRSADNPAFQPFQADAVFDGTGQIANIVYPDHKRLVIEFVSMYVFHSTTCQMPLLQIWTTAGDTGAHFSLPVTHFPAAAGALYDTDVVAQQVRIYSGPGIAVTLHPITTGGICNLTANNMSASISGYLVDVP
jgi:hypothetical protein